MRVKRLGMMRRHTLPRLRTRRRNSKAKIDESKAQVKAWAQQKKTMTADKIAEWKAQWQVKKLNDRADDAESYAVATMRVAAAAVDEAETAAIEAVIARIDADAVQSPARAERPDRKSNSSSNKCQQRSLQ
jgi:hypothetical protein